MAIDNKGDFPKFLVTFRPKFTILDDQYTFDYPILRAIKCTLDNLNWIIG